MSVVITVTVTVPAYPVRAPAGECAGTAVVRYEDTNMLETVPLDRWQRELFMRHEIILENSQVPTDY